MHLQRGNAHVIRRLMLSSKATNIAWIQPRKLLQMAFDICMHTGRVMSVTWREVRCVATIDGDCGSAGRFRGKRFLWKCVSLSLLRLRVLRVFIWCPYRGSHLCPGLLSSLSRSFSLLLCQWKWMVSQSCVFCSPKTVGNLALVRLDHWAGKAAVGLVLAMVRLGH